MTFPYTLPRLPYPTGALEPNLNRATIMTHHDKIFASHTDALNCTLQPYPALQKQSLPQLLLHPDRLPCAIREDVLHRAFTDMWNKLYTNQGTVLEPLLKALGGLAANQPDTEETEQLDREINSLSEQSRILNQVMKKGYMDSALFMESSSKLGWQLTECRRKKTLLARKQKRTKEIVRTEQLIGLLKKEGYQRKFNEELFDLTVKEIRISLTHEITFCLHNGLKLTERGGGQDAVAHANRL